MKYHALCASASARTHTHSLFQAANTQIHSKLQRNYKESVILQFYIPIHLAIFSLVSIINAVCESLVVIHRK